MTVAKKIKATLEKSSWIRKMFEEGAKLKAEFGEKNVFDFSLGNPNLPPPPAFDKVMAELVRDTTPGIHGYMPNTGYPLVRKQVAARMSREHGVDLTENQVIMTCGAAGALNVVLKTLLDPGDEVLTPAPCFVEYGFYIDNHGGVFKTAPTLPDFALDLAALEKALTPKTKVVLVNSPNNPTGRIYDRKSLEGLARILTEASKRFSRTIYLVSDEPYRKIAYDNAAVPSIFSVYPQSIICTSHSKDLSLPGERIGYLAIHPEAADKSLLFDGMALANRILGFVNAPALMQRAVARLTEEKVDVAEYDKKRGLLCDGLEKIGYEFDRPQGAFYLFCKSPIKDDVKFVGMLQKERVLVVPGSGFMGPGHFRICYCVNDETITGSMPGFTRAFKAAAQ